MASQVSAPGEILQPTPDIARRESSFQDWSWTALTPQQRETTMVPYRFGGSYAYDAYSEEQSGR